MRQLQLHMVVWFGMAVMTLLSGVFVLAGNVLKLSSLFTNVSYGVFAVSAVLATIMAFVYGFVKSQMSSRIRTQTIICVTIVFAISGVVTIVLSLHTVSWFAVLPFIVMIVHIGVLLVLLGRRIQDIFG